MPLQPGDTVDRYVIEGLIGAGGMGEVYSARDERLQRRVALKVLREEGGGETHPSSGSKPSTARGATRMLREARAVAALDHTNVVAVFDVGQIEAPGPLQGTTYLAMELIRGVPLRAYVGDRRVPQGERTRWLIDIARALFAAHEQGIIHRDIKPENVMVREDGHIKVLDFGIARAAHGRIDPHTVTQQAPVHATTGSLPMGTPMYMAPEQLRAEPLDGRADQFGWGVMAYELLTGQLPWSADRGPTALLAQVLTETPRRPDQVAADVPVRVADIVMRTLSKGAGERFATMRELLAELGVDTGVRAPALQPLAMQSPSLPTTNPLAVTQLAQPTPEVPVPLPVRKKPSVTRAAIPAALALLAAGAGVAFRAWRPSAPVSRHALSGAVSAPPDCASNRACTDAHGGAPWICRADKTCVPLESEDCKVLAQPGDVASDSTIWLGAIFPTSGDEGRLYADEVRLVDLARRDFAEALAPVGDAPHIGLVLCDAQVDAGRAARHLAEEVRVPASLLDSSHNDELIARSLTPNGVLTMLTLDASGSVLALPPGVRGRLVWRSMYGVGSLVRGASALIEQYVEPRLRAQRPGAPTRVAVLSSKALGERALSEVALRELRVNGTPLSEQPESFLELPLPEDEASCARTEEQLARFVPSVVLVNHVEESQEKTKCGVAWLDAHWPPALPRGVYVYPVRIPRDALEYAARRPDRSGRIFGLDERDEPVASSLLATHFAEVFGDRLPNPASVTSYDGTYVLAYAAYAAGRVHPSGADLAQALARLRGPGKVINVGLQGIREGYSVLLRGESFDLEGVAGHLDLDPESGESRFDIAVMCAGNEPMTHDAANVPSGLWFDSKENRLRGALRCP